MTVEQRKSIPLYLFAKAPVPGRVKTRMFPFLTPELSASLAQRMLEQSLEKICLNWPGRVILTVTPDDQHPAFKALALRHNFETSIQCAGNLGVRLLFVLRQGIAESGGAVVKGCDVPHFDVEILKRTYQLLKSGQNVVGPAEDGGFYLLGLNMNEKKQVKKNPAEEGLIEDALFYGVQWGEDNVLRNVRKNAGKIPLCFTSITTLRDIDNWNDLQWLAQRDGNYQDFLEHSGSDEINADIGD